MEDIFMDYLQCNGSWMSSNLVVKASSSRLREVKGVECYMRYMDLRSWVLC